jgi:hypothetical protein
MVYRLCGLVAAAYPLWAFPNYRGAFEPPGRVLCLRHLTGSPASPGQLPISPLLFPFLSLLYSNASQSGILRMMLGVGDLLADTAVPSLAALATTPVLA